MKQKSIYIPIYHGKLILIQTNDLNSVIRKYNISVSDTCNAFTLHMPNNKYIMVLKESTTHSVIAHESLHIVNFIFLDKGMTPNLTHDEAQCYLLEWVVREVYKFLNK